ncbi:MAG TPA: aminomethyl-transferring glycine dehydrogenase subunit GcvPA [Euzebyales bacterium]|nr:aminomethyl-transferring glycine dehydrogenase subunit GcvPA [Euzebyales bacterium]
MADYAPHTATDIADMLDQLGYEHLDDLFAHIPDHLRVNTSLELPPGRSEDEVLGTMARLASRNRTDLVCFAGGGAYDHYVPSVVDAVLQRGELLTSYTPYQPEVSQGILQILFEYQTMICELTGLPVANASLYDGASAVAEAAAMACAVTRRKGLLVSGAVDAPTRTVIGTYAHPLRRPVGGIGVDATTGTTSLAEVGDDVAAVVVSQPNAVGVVENLRAHAEAAHAAGALLIVKLEPTAVGLLATPGAQGADVVVGDGQSLGQGLQFGGPTVGFLACGTNHVRRLPGRVVGETVDADGRPGYVMTLRTREQDIRRERATSNICTNQTLSAVAATVYLAWLGPQGLRQLAMGCLRRARVTADRLTAIDGVELAFSGPFLKEFALRLRGVDVVALVGALCDEGYLVGPVVDDPVRAGGSLLMVAATERRTTGDITGLATAFERQMKEATITGAGGRGA